MALIFTRFSRNEVSDRWARVAGSAGDRDLRRRSRGFMSGVLRSSWSIGFRPSSPIYGVAGAVGVLPTLYIVAQIASQT